MCLDAFALFIQLYKCPCQFVAFLQLLHRKNITFFRSKQISGNAARLDGVTDHQSRNARRICRYGRMGPRTDKEAAFGNYIFQLRRSMVIYKNQARVMIEVVIKLFQRNAIIIAGPDHMRNQRNISIGVVQNISD